MKVRIENVQGLGSSGRLHNELKKAKQFDISLLQEVKLGRNKEHDIRIKYGHHNCVFLASRITGNGSSRGVLTLFSPRLDIIHLDNVKDVNGQFMINIIRQGNLNLLIGNYYGNPDLDREALVTAERFAVEVERMRRKFRIDEILIGGDFNFVLHQDDTNMTRSKPRTELRWEQFVNDLDLYDPYPILHTIIPHTYYRHRMEWSSARYDRFYVSRGLLEEASIKQLKRMSDHTPVMFEVWKKERKKARWRADDYSLQRVKENKIIQETIASVMRPLVEDEQEEIELKQLQHEVDYERYCPIRLLEKVMMAVRGKLKQETWRKKEEYDKEEKDAIDKLLEARENVNRSNTEANRGDYDEKREKLRVLQEKRVRKAEERNYAQYSRCGERMTRYHFNIMNKGRAAREIRKLKIQENGAVKIMKDSKEIMKWMAEKFAEIARPRAEGQEVKSIEEFLGEVLANGVLKCPEGMTEELGRPITEEEVEKVIKGMKKVSAPGPKGITNNLMKILQPLIGRLIVEAGNKLLYGDDFPGAAEWIYKRTVVFILKPGKDPESDDSYRGLSMLENTFKIYSKILADRLAKVLRVIQDKHQYGFTEGKSCPEPTRTIIDVIRWAKQKGQPLLVLSTDLYKAFDSIYHDHMEKCLEFYGFPEEFRKMCMKMVKNGVMEFEVNGQMSDEFRLERGTGQGDPKSCYLYNLAVLPMNEYLSKSPEVPRFEVEGTSISPVYFADDMLMLLKGDQLEGIKATLKKIAEYEKVSGLKLNLKKCEVMAVNCNERQMAQLVDETEMKRVVQMKHLGVIIGEDGEVGEENNIVPIIEKMDEIANKYRTSGSTPIGRSLYATFLLCQRYVHRLQNSLLTEKMKEDMRDATHAMIWTKGRYAEEQNGYRTHIAAGRIKQPFKYGGLAVPDPDMQSRTIRMGWLRKFRSEYREEGWYIVLSRWLEEIGRPKIEEHMKMGLIEWEKTAVKMKAKSRYWADVYEAGAQIQKLAVKQQKEWHMLPILGIEEGANQGTISSLEYENPEARRIVQCGLYVVGQLFHQNDRGQVNHRRMKTAQEIENEFNLRLNPLMWNTLVAQVQVEVKRKYREQMEGGAVRMTQDTVLEAIVKKHAKGNSAANKLFLKAEREKWSQGEVPPSYATYVRDGLTQIDSEDFMKAFVRIRRSELMASFQWTSTQVLLRTLWTKVKEVKARPMNVDDRCVNCGQFPEHTVHLLFECQLMQGVLTRVERMVNRQFESQIVLNRDVVLFHVQPDGLSDEMQRDLTDVLMIVKHVIYRLRFRENVNVMPTVKAAIIDVILEMQKFDKICESDMQKFIWDLRGQINWQ